MLSPGFCPHPHDELYFFNNTNWIKTDKKTSVKYVRTFLNNYNLGKLNLNSRNYSEICKMLLTDPSLEKNQNDFWSKKFLINCKGGIFDVRDNEIIPACPEYGFFYNLETSVHEIGNGTGYYFEQYINNISNGNEKIRQLLLEVIGISIANVKVKKFFLLFGPSNTGKSQFITFLQKLIGFKNTMVITQLKDLAKQWTLGNLMNMRLCVCSDLANTKVGADEISKLKQIVGDDPTCGEVKFEQPKAFYPEATVLFASNHKLKIVEASSEKALLNRLVVIPFENPIPEEKQIEQLYDKLLAEAPYIIFEAAKALRDLEARNFVFSEVVPAAYGVCDISVNAPIPSDVIEDFIKKCCIFDSNYTTSSNELYTSYTHFCESYAVVPISNIGFFRQLPAILSDFNTTYKKRSDLRGYEGIKIKEEFNNDK